MLTTWHQRLTAANRRLIPFALRYMALWTFVVLTLILMVIFANLYSDRFRRCVGYYENREHEQHIDYKDPVTRTLTGFLKVDAITIDAQTVCVLDRIDKHAGFFSLLTSVVVAFFTFTLWRSTQIMAKATEGQGKAMENSIKEAARAASAMEGVAKSLEINARQIVVSVGISKEIAERQRDFGQRQLRAYISVLIGQATYQDERNRFEARPIIVNNGNTFAMRVKWRICAAILPNPLPDNFAFPLPQATKGSSILGPGKDGTMAATVAFRVSPDRIENIKRGAGDSLYVWGTVRYFDVFGKIHRNTFAQRIFWMPGQVDQNWQTPESVFGFHLHKHNNAS